MTAPVSPWQDRLLDRAVAPGHERAVERMVAVGGRLVAAAKELLVETGSLAFTVQDVAKRAKVAIATMYTYFAGKDELLLAAFEDASRIGAETLTARLASEPEHVARLRIMVRDQLLLPLTVPDLRYFIVLDRERARLGELFPEAVWAAISPLVAMMEEEIGAAAAAGAIAPTDARQDAALIFRLIGSHLTSITGGAVEDPDAVADQVWGFVARALGVRGAAAGAG